MKYKLTIFKLSLIMLIYGCSGDYYYKDFGPIISEEPAVFNRLPPGLRSKSGSSDYYIACVRASESGNADASYLVAILIGRGLADNYKTREDKERGMIEYMRRSKSQGCREAAEFISIYEKIGVQRWE